MTNPLVSFVIPAYNASGTLQETLESLPGCGVSDYEVVLVNDGSSDDTANVASRLLRPHDTFANFGVNRGLSTALNTGLALARGKFIARIDADDLCVPGRISRQVEFLESCQEFAFCGTAIEYFGGRQGTHVYPSGFHACNAGLAVYSCFAHPATLLNRERLGGDFYYDPRLDTSEDYDLWVRLQRAGKFGTNLPFVGLKYRISSQSYTATRSAKYRRNDLAIRRNALSNLLQETESPYILALACLLSIPNFARHPGTYEQLRMHVDCARPKSSFEAAWRLVVHALNRNLSVGSGGGQPMSDRDFKLHVVRESGWVMRYPR